MIFNDELIFIHIGKTGGMSCSWYLLKCLKGQVYNCHRTASKDFGKHLNPKVINYEKSGRHITLEDALKVINEINAKKLNDFKKVLAVIRNPYTLEYSYYKHMRKPAVKKLRSPDSKIVKLAEGNFKDFIKKSGYHSPNKPQEAFFTLDGVVPGNVSLVKMERLSEDLPNELQGFVNKEGEVGHTNKSVYDESLLEVFTDEIQYLIYKKHQYMFDNGYYSRDITKLFEGANV